MRKMFAVRDIKANMFFDVFPQPTEQLAQRGFAEVVNGDPSTNIAKYPEDFQLFYLGEYDEQKGVIEGLKVPQMVCSGLDVLISNVTSAKEPEDMNGSFRESVEVGSKEMD